MPDIEASYTPIDIILCGEAQGKAYGSICLFLDTDIHKQFSVKGVGRIGSTIKSRTSYNSLELELNILSIKGYTKGVIRGLGKGLGLAEIHSTAKGLVRSVVTGAGRAELRSKGAPFSPSPSKVLSPIYKTKDLRILLSHWNSFLPEIGIPILNYESKKAFENQGKVSIEVLKEYTTSMDYIGDRRNWLVARVLYEDCPVMYICNAGWQGTYNPVKYVIDKDRYQYMNFYLWSLMRADKGASGVGALSGMLNDRQRIVQPEVSRIQDLPIALREIMIQVGDISTNGY